METIDEIKDQNLFNRIAHEYLRKDIYPVSKHARQAQLFSLMSLIDKPMFTRIVEIGCGPGYSAVYLKGKYKNYLGYDYSEEFINFAKKLNIANTGFYSINIKDISDTEIEGVDLVLGVGILHHIDNIDVVLKHLHEITNKDTCFAFVEPSAGNPLIQFTRWIRKKTDKNYNEDQRFFMKKEIIQIFERNDFVINIMKYQGYFSTPFAQVILKPAFIFMPICKLFVWADKFIQNHLNNSLSWNLIWTASKK